MSCIVCTTVGDESCRDPYVRNASHVVVCQSSVEGCLKVVTPSGKSALLPHHIVHVYLDTIYHHDQLAITSIICSKLQAIPTEIACMGSSRQLRHPPKDVIGWGPMSMSVTNLSIPLYAFAGRTNVMEDRRCIQRPQASHLFFPPPTEELPRWRILQSLSLPQGPQEPCQNTRLISRYYFVFCFRRSEEGVECFMIRD